MTMNKLQQKGLCARIARRRRQGSEGSRNQGQGWRDMKLMEKRQRQHSGDETREEEDYLTHEDPRGAGGHT